MVFKEEEVFKHIHTSSSHLEDALDVCQEIESDITGNIIWLIEKL